MPRQRTRPQPGDVVKVKEGVPGVYEVGERGVIVKCPTGVRRLWYGISFLKHNKNRGSIYGMAQPGHGCWVKGENLEIIRIDLSEKGIGLLANNKRRNPFDECYR